jgi:hypothetical protein
MSRGFFDVRQNGDSTGDGIVSDDIGLSFVYLMCLCFCIFVLFYFCFIHALYRFVSCITYFNFLAHTSFRLGGGLAAYLMTFSQGLSLCKPQLFVECLD